MNVPRTIDRINDRVGAVLCYIVIFLMLITVYDVVARYVFNRPTKWAYAINVFLMGTMIPMGAGYVLLHRSHVAVDIATRHLSDRGRAVMDLVTSPLVFVFCLVLIWKGWDLAWESLKMLETARGMLLEIPLYPLKIFVVVGGVLLFLQVIAKFIRDLNTARTGKIEKEIEV